ILSPPMIENYLTHESLAHKNTLKFAVQLNCSDNKSYSVIIDCLRNISADELLKSATSDHILNKKEIADFIYGDDILPYPPRVAFEKRIFCNELDLLIGNVDHETPDLIYSKIYQKDKNLKAM